MRVVLRNGRDWLSEELPNDELNRLDMKKLGQHYGYPYCHQGDFADPQFGWGKACEDFVKPVLLLGPHSAPLGMRFYTGKMFPSKYQNAIFVARHGPWNRTKKYAADVVAVTSVWESGPLVAAEANTSLQTVRGLGYRLCEP